MRGSDTISLRSDGSVFTTSVSEAATGDTAVGNNENWLCVHTRVCACVCAGVCAWYIRVFVFFDSFLQWKRHHFNREARPLLPSFKTGWGCVTCLTKVTWGKRSLIVRAAGHRRAMIVCPSVDRRLWSPEPVNDRSMQEKPREATT